MKRTPLAVVFALASFVPALAAAQTALEAPAPATAPAPAPANDPAPATGAGEPKRTVSVTFSPFHLVLPIFEVTAEVKVHPKFSVAAIGGGGTVKSGDLRIQVYEVGGQLRGYPLGNFDSGMTIALEALYLGAKASANGVSAKGAGLSIGPAIGYKHAFDFGLTLDGQLGISYLAARASATDGTTSASNSGSRIGPILNLNAGWSF
jgi:hypothetical protein